MASIGRYCKAYSLSELRKFEGWEEKAGDSARPLTDDTILYLQESYVVTDGIFVDENIIFDNVTTEWIEFCRQPLSFEVPEYESIK